MVVYTYKHYVVLDTGKDLVIKNAKGERKNHAHFVRKTNKQGEISLNTVQMVIRLCCQKRTDIKSRYILNAIIRLTNDEEYRQELLHKRGKTKQNYYNVKYKTK